MDVNFELYKIFYHVARTGSFSAAANALYISQSAVSQNIKNLEQKLGNELFFRKSRQIKLTPEGELLYHHITQAYQWIKNAENQLDQIHGLEAGEIRIGASDTVCKYFLLPYFRDFRKAYPQIKIRVVNRTSAQIKEILKKGDIDFGIVTLPQSDSQVRADAWKTVADIFVAAAAPAAAPAPQYAALKDKKNSLTELLQFPMLLLEKSSTARQNLDRFLRDRHLEIAPELELESNDLLLEFARIGFGIAYVLRDSALPDLASGSLFEVQVADALPPHPIGIITLNHAPLPKSAQRFLELLRENP